MKQLSWQDISVQQFQDIYKLTKDQSVDPLERVDKSISILFDLTERQVEEMPVLEYNERAKLISFVLNSDKIPGKAKRKIKVGKETFSITYDPTKLMHRQYVEVIHFSEDVIFGMHKILASIVQPVNWYGKKMINNVEDHATLSSKMLDARVVDVYHACVFFCKLYVSLIHNIRDYLVQQMMSQGQTEKTANGLITLSLDSMVGFIQQEKWQPSKV